MAFAPPRKSLRPESVARSPSCPPRVSRSSTTNPQVQQNFFASTPYVDGGQRQPRGRPSMIRRHNSVKSVRPSISTSTRPDRRSSSLDRALRIIADHDGSSSSSSSGSGSGNGSDLSKNTIRSKPKIIFGAGFPSTATTTTNTVASNSRMSMSMSRKSVSGSLLQPKLFKEEIKITSEKQKELEMLKIQLQNASLKYLNSAVLLSVFRGSAKKELKHQVTDTIKIITDEGLVKTRKNMLIDTVKAKRLKDPEKWLELVKVLENLMGIKSFVGSRQFRQKLNSLDKKCSQLFDFIPIEGLDFGSEHQKKNWKKIGELIKMMDISTSSFTDDGRAGRAGRGGSKVFVSLLKSGEISENEEAIKRDLKLLKEFKKKLTELYSLKASIRATK